LRSFVKDLESVITGNGRLGFEKKSKLAVSARLTGGMNPGRIKSKKTRLPTTISKTEAKIIQRGIQKILQIFRVTPFTSQLLPAWI
jgi:hypothetical protein